MKKNLLLLLAASGILFYTETFAQNLKRRAFLGVQLSPVTDSLAKAHKLKENSGARVVRIVPNSTAETLKLQPNDVILEVNKTAVKNPNEVVGLARNLQPGETVNLTLNRKGKKVNIKGKVQPMPFETAAA